MTDSFGARLRRERERQHITLAQIAAVTKIKASLFEGLERDDVSRWPGGIFRRSFIRAYAEAIGLNADDTCREFTARFPDAADGIPSARTELPTRAAVPAVPVAVAPAAPVAVAPAAPVAVAPAAPVAAAPAAPIAAEPDVPPALSAVTPLHEAALDDDFPLRLTPAAFEDIPNRADIPGKIDEDEPGLRLTLADSGALPSTAEPASRPGLDDLDTRWPALALDVAVLLVISITAFVVLGVFWMPLAVTSLTYFFGSTALLGRTAGVAFFATTVPRAMSKLPASVPAAAPLERSVDMRDTLRADPQDEASEARVVRPYAAIRPPVDIESRRARA